MRDSDIAETDVNILDSGAKIFTVQSQSKSSYHRAFGAECAEKSGDKASSRSGNLQAILKRLLQRLRT